ncbi:MAG: hypothetical protein ABW156_06090 [Jiangellaceae bacterium]
MTAVSLVMLAGACAQGSTAPATATTVPKPSPVVSDGPVWYSIAGGCPTLSSWERITDGAFGSPNGHDDATLYTVSCSYGKLDPAPEVFVSIEIERLGANDRDLQDRNWQQKLGTAKLGAQSAGNLLIDLPGVGDAGFVAAGDTAGKARPTVLATARSGNAFVSANVRLDQPIHDQSDLAAQFPALRAVLADVLDDLRA